MRLPTLYIADILAWAKEYRERHGRWPRMTDGPVAGQIDVTWLGIDNSLRNGGRGLRPGSSLARLLQKSLGVRNLKGLPKLKINTILSWADANQERANCWPTRLCGKISGVPGETWNAIDKALRKGVRGLPGRSSLAQLLAARRGARNNLGMPKLSENQILAWADAHYTRTGKWPTRHSGAIESSGGENWQKVNHALERGNRGVSLFGSLAQFLAKHRRARNRMASPNLSERQILKWADAYFEQSGKWPSHISGPIPESAGETWGGVHGALYRGIRGFAGGDSLHKLLVRSGRKG